MFKFRKKMWLLLLMLLCAVPVAGCGRNRAAGKAEAAYRLTSEEISTGGNPVMAVQPEGDTLYLCVNETGAAGASLFKTAVNTGNGGAAEKLFRYPGKPAETFVAFFRNENGDCRLLSEQAANERQQYFFYEVSANGELIKETDISDIIQAAGGAGIQQTATDSAGHFYLTMSSADIPMATVLLHLGADGAAQGSFTTTDRNCSLITTADGSSYLCGTAYSAADNTSASAASLKKIDWSAGSVGPEIPLTGCMGATAFDFMPGGSTGVLLGNNFAVFECDVTTGRCTKVLTWLEQNLSAAEIGFWGPDQRDGFWSISQNQNLSADTGAPDPQLTVLEKTTADKVPPKTVLTMGSTYLNSSLERLIIDFNKSSHDYQVRLEIYGENDYATGRTQLNNALTSSAPPDIIDLSSTSPEQLVSKGILADLNTFMTRDDTFKKADYLENVLKNYEKDGRQYGIATGITVVVMVGYETLLQDFDHWSMKEMIAFAKQHPDATLLANSNNDFVLETLFSAAINDFVDWGTGTCSFDNEDFTNILEYSNTYGPDTAYVDYTAFVSGEYLIISYYLKEPADIPLVTQMLGGPVKYIGYPTSDEQNSGIRFITNGPSLGMNEQSPNKEGVWAFIKYALGDEYQQNFIGGWVSGLPIKRSALDNVANTALAAAENTDPNAYPSFAVTADDIATFRAVLEAADTTMYDFDPTIMAIVKEEAAGFFTGQKSVTETIAIIENRVQIYMDENK